MGQARSREAQGLANHPPQEAPSLHLLVVELVDSHRHMGREDVTDVEVAVILWEEVHIVEEDTVPFLLLHGLPEPHVA